MLVTAVTTDTTYHPKRPKTNEHYSIWTTTSMQEPHRSYAYCSQTCSHTEQTHATNATITTDMFGTADIIIKYVWIWCGLWWCELHTDKGTRSTETSQNDSSIQHSSGHSIIPLFLHNMQFHLMMSTSTCKLTEQLLRMQTIWVWIPVLLYFKYPYLQHLTAPHTAIYVLFIF
jgi:hypothetical protein